MVEMAALDGASTYRQGIAGDTFNTAVYLARTGHDVSYLSHLGDDSLSDGIVAAMTAEGIDTGLVTRRHGRRPGLYLIDNDDSGERQFSYWRNEAPVRQMFDQAVAVAGPLESVEAFYFSGITLAVTRSGSEQLLDLLQRLRARSCRIAFDPNYRPHLWDNVEQAQACIRQILPMVDIALPTLEDETALWGVQSVDECRALYQQYDVEELVIKGADLTSHVFCPEQSLSQRAEAVAATDTTGAGDSFNGAYLGARWRGDSIQAALTAAQSLSAQVVQHRGAILPAAKD